MTTHYECGFKKLGRMRTWVSLYCCFGLLFPFLFYLLSLIWTYLSYSFHPFTQKDLHWWTFIQRNPNSPAWVPHSALSPHTNLGVSLAPHRPMLQPPFHGLILSNLQLIYNFLFIGKSKSNQSPSQHPIGTDDGMCHRSLLFQTFSLSFFYLFIILIIMA